MTSPLAQLIRSRFLVVVTDTFFFSDRLHRPGGEGRGGGGLQGLNNTPTLYRGAEGRGGGGASGLEGGTRRRRKRKDTLLPHNPLLAHFNPDSTNLFHRSAGIAMNTHLCVVGSQLPCREAVVARSLI